MIKSLLVAIGLVLVLEGIMPALAPKKWRQTILLLASQKDKFLRRMGLTLMIIGAVIVVLVHHLM